MHPYPRCAPAHAKCSRAVYPRSLAALCTRACTRAVYPRCGRTSALCTRVSYPRCVRAANLHCVPALLACLLAGALVCGLYVRAKMPPTVRTAGARVAPSCLRISLRISALRCTHSAPTEQPVYGVHNRGEDSVAAGSGGRHKWSPECVPAVVTGRQERRSHEPLRGVEQNGPDVLYPAILKSSQEVMRRGRLLCAQRPRKPLPRKHSLPCVQYQGTHVN